MLVNRRAHPAGATFGTWTAPDGWVHRRMDWPQAEGVKPRGSLLFAGGRGDFIEKYLEAFGQWHREGWNVTAFDWRGQGASRGKEENKESHGLDRLVEDLGALVSEWSESGPEPHVAVAHSMGGHVLLRTLAELRPRLAAAVLVAPMIAINSGPMPAWSASWLATAMSAFGWAGQPAWHQPRSPMPAGSLRQSILTGCPERYEDELYWWEKQPGFNVGPPSWGWLDAAYRSSARFTPAALGGISVPVLLLGTAKDRLVSPAAIRRAASLIPGAELHMYPDAGHEILRERDEIRLDAHARIAAFLEKHSGR
ncbi:MAG TPA: alpha/beta hydrolase [Allosphingosinicella sp.]